MEPLQIIYGQLVTIARDAIALLPQIVIAVIVLVLTYFTAWGGKSAIRKALTHYQLRLSLNELFVNLSSIGIWLLGLMIAAVIVFPNLTPTSVLAGLGLGSIAIGFAFKDIFENFIAGILILFRKKMQIGDFIECESLEGKVEHITIRETYIRRTDGQLVIVPNSLLFKNPLTILTDLPVRRTTITIGVGYDDDVDRAREVIFKAVESCATVISDSRPIQIFAQNFGASSIDFEVTWWTGSTPVEIRKSKDEVVAVVKRALDGAGIEMPYPYRTLTFKEALPLRREAPSENA